MFDIFLIELWNMITYLIIDDNRESRKKINNNLTRKLCEIVYKEIRISKTMDCKHLKYFWEYDYIVLLVGRRQFS
jgi:hypothetical protein